jgi:hypothetical protein
LKLLVRLLATLVSTVSTYYFVFWVGGALLLRWHLSPWLSFVVAVAAGASVGRYVWRHTALFQPGLVSSIGLGAFVTGAVGFAGGFFGPIIFTPDANQGPLLGLFITGPLGFLLGAIGGAVYWLAWGRRR